MAIRIPEDLLSLVRERRVIPFVGAGFSSGLGLPGWSGLLRQVATDLRISETEPKLDFASLSQDASEDFLRVAEYLYLRAGSNIGPLRLSISHALTIPESLASSTPHIELLNLGAPQIYTTNFDDAIEATYRELQQPMEVVALPRDVAVADPSQTQIVKYHGDLRYDDTLVLTESQYWRRLDLESPMDLKFRSDLLGRSVLFMGYSFSDINIRVIWFKLMRMMEDVPESDRKPSYIVRFEPNPVLEALYHSVGLTTIVLDPKGEASTDEDRTRLLGEFLSDLATAACVDTTIPGSTTQKMFVSMGLILRAETEVKRLLGPGVPWLANNNALSVLYRRDVPAGLQAAAYEVIKLLAHSEANLVVQIDELLSWACNVWGAQPEITVLALRGLMLGSREDLLKADLPWADLWAVKIPDDLLRPIFRNADNELRGHETMNYLDNDLAYAVDVLRRLADGLAAEADTRESAQELIVRAGGMYPSALTYEPPLDGPPDPRAIADEIAVRAQDEEEGDVAEAVGAS